VTTHGPNSQMPQSAPSPLMGEGARRADEGGAANAAGLITQDDAQEPIFVPAEDPAPKQSRLRRFARELRRESTPHERLLWAYLRDRRFAKFKFRRQVPIGPFVVDFVCFEARLIVELDGSQHADDELYDGRRGTELERRGFRVLRFWNGNLTGDKLRVLDLISIALEEASARVASPSSALRAPSPIKGEGDGAAASRAKDKG
jgi:very-short-patch-repair endonuclease